MITRENIGDVIQSLSDKDKKRVLNSNKEYAVLYLHTFNVGSYATVRLTNDYGRYQYVSNNGNAILCIEEVQTLLEETIKTDERSK